MLPNVGPEMIAEAAVQVSGGYDPNLFAVRINYITSFCSPFKDKKLFGQFYEFLFHSSRTIISLQHQLRQPNPQTLPSAQLQQAPPPPSPKIAQTSLSWLLAVGAVVQMVHTIGIKSPSCPWTPTTQFPPVAKASPEYQRLMVAYSLLPQWHWDQVCDII